MQPWGLINGGMKALSAKEQLRKEQRAYLEQIVARSGLTLSEIAKEAGVSSTTLTRFYNNKNATHAISSTTMDKVHKRFPIDRAVPPSPSNETTLVTVSLFSSLVNLLLKKRTILPSELEEILTHTGDLYRAHQMPEAVKVVDALRSSLTPGSQQLGKEAIGILLRLHPAGSA
jgi:AcrR family transcriptional regulator